MSRLTRWISDQRSKHSERLQSPPLAEAVEPEPVTDPRLASWGQILWTQPLVLQIWPSVGFPIGLLSCSNELLADTPTCILLNPAWTFETAGRHYHLDAIRAHQAAHPLHHFRFVANTCTEAALMAVEGVTGITASQNCLMNERVFRPLPDVAPIHDAIYNSRLSPQKRVELVSDLDRVALVYFYDPFEFSVDAFHQEHARLSAFLPRATFVNGLSAQGCAFLDATTVNQQLARARVGLCLSPVEGAMRASIEYLFAGLSVVSTPSLGGRDRYFDPEYCIITDPDPRSIREAVAALVERSVPRDYVRAKTLQKVEADRSRYIGLVQSLIASSGERTDFEPRFRSLLYGEGLMLWRSTVNWQQALRLALSGA